MDMAIAAASIDISASRVMTEVGTTVLSKSKDMAEQSATELISTMLPPPVPAGSIGSQMDFYA